MTHPSQEAVRIVENFWETGHGQAVATRMGEHYKEALSRMFIDMLTTYAQTIREEERERIREALNKGYEDTFHWGSGLSEPTHITEKEFGIIVNEALTNKV